MVLSRIGILDSHHIARTLYQSVLKAASSSDKRPITAACKLNPAQHAGKILVGTSWRSPETMKHFQFTIELWIEEGVSGQPLDLGCSLQDFCCVLDGLLDGRQGGRRGVVVTENANVDGIGHDDILKDEVVTDVYFPCANDIWTSDLSASSTFSMARGVSRMKAATSVSGKI